MLAIYILIKVSEIRFTGYLDLGRQRQEKGHQKAIGVNGWRSLL